MEKIKENIRVFELTAVFFFVINIVMKGVYYLYIFRVDAYSKAMKILSITYSIGHVFLVISVLVALICIVVEIMKAVDKTKEKE